MMKKIFACMIGALSALLIATAAFAAFEAGRISLTSKLESPVRGQSFTVNLELNRNPGVYTLRTLLSYDETVLELVSVQDKGLLPSFSQEKSESGKTTLHWKAPSGGGNLTETGVLASLVFRIRDDAPYGSSRITVDFSQRLFDATNKSGASLNFDVKAFEFSLVCSHLNTKTETVTAPKFSETGVGKVICSDCGESWESVLYPEILSEDKKTRAVSQAGEFTDDGEKSVRVEFFFGGDEFLEAKSLFGDGVIRAFQIHFTRENISYLPAGETTIYLTTEFEAPKNFALYLVGSGGAQKVDAAWKNGTLSFLWGEGYFVLVEREETPVVSFPEENEKDEPISDEVPVTRSPEDEAKEREVVLIVLGIFGLILCGTGAVFVLRRGKSL